MSEATTLPKTVSIDGVEYEVEKLSDRVKRLIAIYGKWTDETAELRLSLAKNEAALRDLTREISETVKTEAAETTEVVGE
jgi:hypothetical protein